MFTPLAATKVDISISGICIETNLRKNITNLKHDHIII